MHPAGDLAVSLTCPFFSPSLFACQMPPAHGIRQKQNQLNALGMEFFHSLYANNHIQLHSLNYSHNVTYDGFTYDEQVGCNCVESNESRDLEEMLERKGKLAPADS